MNETAHVAPHQPSQPRTPRNKPRRLVSLPDPTSRLLERLAVLQGVSMSDALYMALRNTLHREEVGEGWGTAPPPFSIKLSYFEDWIGVLCFNPHLPSPVLSGAEACQLASALYDAVDGKPIDFELISSRGGHRITLSRGPAHVALHIDGEKYPMVRPVARDVAVALEEASVGASPRPFDGVH